MALLIGIDEAGYGPNLGPLVIAATVWTVADPTFDPWTAFAGIVAQTPDPSGQTVQIADSKAVHSACAGVAALERSATVLLDVFGQRETSLFRLWDTLTRSAARLECPEPYFSTLDVTLPLVIAPQETAPLSVRWSDQCQRLDCVPTALVAEIISASQFNAAVTGAGSKGRVLSQATFRLLRRVWDGSTPALVLCDKHGGRNRYGDLLGDAFSDWFPLCLEESRAVSRYRIGAGEVRIQTRAEAHLPVAAASLVAKYLREACMAAFNRFWMARQPGLRPTAGYPVDAKRFLDDIEADAQSLGLCHNDFWRCR